MDAPSVPSPVELASTTRSSASKDRLLLLCVASGLIHFAAGAWLLQTWEAKPVQASAAPPPPPAAVAPHPRVVRLELAVKQGSAAEILQRSKPSAKTAMKPSPTE